MPETVVEPINTNIDLTDPPTSSIEPTKPDEPLLAGKFKTPEELEKAYKELEGKLGQTKEPDEPAEPKEPEQPEIMVAGLPASKYFKEFEETGAISEDSYKELADKGIPKELVDAYIEGQKARVSQSQDLSEKAVNDLITDIGGKEAFDKMRAWANTGGLTEDEKNTYATAVDSGDPRITKMAMENLKAKYEAAYGHAPNLVEGQAATGPSAFKSNAEMVAAMRDPRYNTDPAYTREVERKVAGMK